MILDWGEFATRRVWTDLDCFPWNAGFIGGG